ncbi:hypothetical protein [Bizionia arctica]|uniref:Tetratricopeptide repeat protein n=1 Tax=Bizionia arctica TaxID=1495645 RepID=A0A917GMC4_9FLAO|nr:hypothetical protein [Bizionia arctica]GGG50892.1 hypothetical protein GCM10010976_22570 [Bizionia arctica]
MKTLYTFCCFLFCISFGFSQEGHQKLKIEELKNRIKQSTGITKLFVLDTLTSYVKYEEGYEILAKEAIDLALELHYPNIAIKHINYLINFHTNISENSEKGLTIFKDFINSNQTITDTLLLSDLYLKAGNSYFGIGEVKEAKNSYEYAAKMALIKNDSIRFAIANNYKAFTLLEMGFFTKASQEYQKSLSVFQSKKDTINILNTRIGLSVVYGKNAFYKESLEELFKVRNMALKLKDSTVYSISMSNIAVNYYYLKKYNQTINFLKENIKLSEKIPYFHYNSAHDYTYLAKSFIKLDSLNQARIVIKKLEEKWKKTPDKQLHLFYLDSKTHLLFAEKNYIQANIQGVKLLELQNTTLNYENILATLNILYKTNEALGNESIAYSYFKKHTHLNDSINSVLKVNGLSHYQTLYETEKKDTEISSQKSKINLLAEKSKVQFQWILLLALSIIVILVLLYLLQLKSKQKVVIAKNKQELTQQKIKATKLENDLLNREIEYKKKDLENLAIEITQNQEWASMIFKKLNALIKLKGQKREIELIAFKNEIKSKMLVNEKEQNFQMQVDLLSSSFYDKLNKQVPNLSKTDLRMCSLIRMKLNTKQIAVLQNISPASVRTSKYRLRKKFNLIEDQDFNSYIINY